MEHYNSKKNMMEINLDDETNGGVGVKRTKKEGKRGQILNKKKCVQNSSKLT